MEAETGHGQYIRSVLEQVPFEEQIHIAHQIEHLNKSHAVLGDLPEIKFVAQNDSWDEKSKFGYSNFKLYRKIPGEGWGPFDKEELLYESSLNLTTGNKTATDNDL
jgi:hypothetical protein